MEIVALNYQVFMLSYQHNGLKKYYGDCYMELYRFRSCDKLLGNDYKELEEQYFTLHRHLTKMILWKAR